MSFLYINESDPNFLFLQTTDQRISDFLKLPQGWHYGEGHAPNEKTVNDSLLINNQATLLGLKTEAFPGINGEIEIDCYSKDKTLEFTIESTGKILLVEDESGIETSSQEDLTIKDALDFIRKEYGRKIWNLSEQSTEGITTNSESDLLVWRLRIPLMEAEYQLYPALA